MGPPHMDLQILQLSPTNESAFVSGLHLETILVAQSYLILSSAATSVTQHFGKFCPVYCHCSRPIINCDNSRSEQIKLIPPLIIKGTL